MLNSDTYYFWLYNRGKRKGEVLELFQKPLSEIPIIIPDKDIQTELVTLADNITELRKNDRYADASEYENRINKIIDDLFGFTEKEIDMIKSTGKKGE